MVAHRVAQADPRQLGKYHVDKPSVAFKEGKKCTCLYAEEQGLYMPPVYPKNLARGMQTMSL